MMSSIPVATTESESERRPSVSARVRIQASLGRARIWAITALVWLAALAGLGWMFGLERAVGFEIGVGWWRLALGFAVAELLVVHLQFRRDAHTFSMSEIPMTLGLLLSTPIGLVGAQMFGSALALALYRRQRPAKLVFNVGQLALQTTAAVAVFRAISRGSVAFDGRTVLALLAANVVALFVGHSAVLTAIRVSGGTESWRETLRVLGVSSLGTVAATLLGVGMSLALVAAPALWWLGLVPVVLVFVAYRAYVGQSEDKGRVEALFDAATTLHRTPQIDLAVEAAAARVLDLVKAETAMVVLTPTRDDDTAYVTVVNAGGRSDAMRPYPAGGDVDVKALLASPGGRVASADEVALIARMIGRPLVRQAILVVLSAADEPVGFVAGVDRLGDVSAFEEDDLRVLATLGSQLSTTLENGRLVDTLAELHVLKGRLESLIESKDRLVASVSHELRTPLTGVIGLAAMIREGADDVLDEESRTMLDLIVEQGNELANIIEDLLTHARAEAGTLTVRSGRFDLTAEAAIVSAAHQLDPPSCGPVWAFADPLRTRQVLRNLITNARRYGGPTIRMVVQADAGQVSIAVVDDGIGVPDTKGASIFDPYLSAHDQRGQPGSVGLGLSVSRTIARLMDGDLTYARRDGHTWFTLTLPVDRSAGGAFAA